MYNIKKLLISFKDGFLIMSIFLSLYLSFELGFHYYETASDRIISPHFIDYPIVGGILLIFSILSHIIIKKTKDKIFPKKIIDEDVIDIYDKIDELSERLHRKDQEVLESEKKYRNLFENASDLILILNEDGCLVDCNKKTLLTFGISNVNDFINTPIINVIEKRKSKITQFNDVFNTVIKGNLAYFEFDIYNSLTKKKSILDASFNPVSIGKHIYVQGILRDITTKKQLEEELKNSNDKYQTLYTLLRSISDNIPDMLWAKNKIKKYIFANKTLCSELLNCSDPEDVIGKTDLEYALKNRTKFKHDFGEMCMDSDDTVMTSLKPQTFHEYGYALGKWLDLEVNKAPFFDSDNNLIGTVGVGRDITSRLKLINEVNERDERFQKLFDSASDAIIISKSGQITDVNKKAIDLFGYSKEEFCNKSVLDISSPIQYNNKIIRKVEECYDSCCLDNYSDNITIWNHKKHDGTIFSTEITCNLVTIKQEHYTQTILRDVSDRITIEQKLQKSEQLYKETIDALPYMVHVVDKSHRIMLWNNKFEEFLNKFGLDSTNIKNKKLYDILNIDSPDSIKNQFDYILTTGQNSVYTHKITVNANIFDYTVHRFPVRNGHISGVLSLLTENVKTNKKEMIVSNHEFDDLIDIIHDGAILFNYEIGNIIDVNNLFLDITEYSKEELLSKNISGIDIWKTFNVYGKYKEYSDILVTKNGIEKFGQLFLEIIEVNYKKFGLLMIRDITFDKDIIDSYRKKVMEHNIIIDNIPIPFYCKSLDGKYTLCNNEFQKFVGKSKDEILGSTVFDIFPNAIANLHFTNEESSIKGTYCYEYKIRNNEIYNICYNYINTDKFNGFIGTIMNISNYKLKELELLKYKELLYFIVNHIKHPIYVKDILGNYLIVNQIFLNEFNLHDNDVRVKINETKIFQQDILEKIQEIDRTTIRNNSYSGLNIISSNFKKITQKYINFNDDEYIIGFMY